MNTGTSFTGTPAAEVEIDDALIEALLADQHPDLANLPLKPLEAGWDNAMFRLGEELVIRLPRRAAAASLIVNEQNWLPRIADHLPLPVPVPLRTGLPASGYPWNWSIVPWIPGTAADHAEPASGQAVRFGAFLRALHTPAPPDAPANPVRGVPLAARAAGAEPRMQRVAARTDCITPRIRQIWNEALAAPIDVPSTWLHGDLHARNVLVEQGVITGVIDWGDITSGDCATDLAAIWMLFPDPAARREALVAYGGVTGPTVLRAQGWAALFGIMLLDSGLVDNPRNAVLGERVLRTVTHSPVG